MFVKVSLTAIIKTHKTIWFLKGFIEMKKVILLFALCIVCTYVTSGVARTLNLEKNPQMVIDTDYGKSGKSNTATSNGHEATHVIQQRGHMNSDADGYSNFATKKRTGRNPQTGAEIKTK